MRLNESQQPMNCLILSGKTMKDPNEVISFTEYMLIVHSSSPHKTPLANTLRTDNGLYHYLQLKYASRKI